MQEYFIILLPAFLLGVLHTAIPCEDKAIFFFFSSGISKTPRSRAFLLTLYGLGLMSANLTIAGFTALSSLVPRFFGIEPDRYASNFFGALSSTFVAIGFLFFVTVKDYMPHSRYKDEITQLDWQKVRTPYLFGLLAGFPPCFFELFIYSQCFTYSLSYSLTAGFLTVFYFSLGTFIGLYPLALAQYGTARFFSPKDGNKKNTIFYLMLVIIIIFNVIVMILSFFRFDVFAVGDL